MLDVDQVFKSQWANGLSGDFFGSMEKYINRFTDPKKNRILRFLPIQIFVNIYYIIINNIIIHHAHFAFGEIYILGSNRDDSSLKHEISKEGIAFNKGDIELSLEVHDRVIRRMKFAIDYFSQELIKYKPRVPKAYKRLMGELLPIHPIYINNIYSLYVRTYYNEFIEQFIQVKIKEGDFTTALSANRIHATHFDTFLRAPIFMKMNEIYSPFLRGPFFNMGNTHLGNQIIDKYRYMSENIDDFSVSDIISQSGAMMDLEMDRTLFLIQELTYRDTGYRYHTDPDYVPLKRLNIKDGALNIEDLQYKMPFDYRNYYGNMTRRQYEKLIANKAPIAIRIKMAICDALMEFVSERVYNNQSV